MDYGLKDKVAVVTGATSGLGQVIARQLAAAGAKVVVAGSREGGEAFAEEIGGLYVRGDMGKREDCKTLIDAALEKYGTVHILVNNAGFQHVASVEEFPEDTWDRMQAVMLTAPFLLTKYSWPAMKTQGWGRIVNIGSMHSLVASPFKSAYTAAKHGLVGFTKSAALEGGACGITVNAICPAYIATPLVDNQIAAQSRTRGVPESEVVEKVLLEPAAIKRLITSEEVADFVLFLCGPSGSAFTGAALSMDLGWTAR